jgi:transposase InsO family protein
MLYIPEKEYDEDFACMETQWIADRAALRCLSRQHPDWTYEELAACIGRSVSWIKKWLRRLRQAPPDDLAVLHSHSRARHTPPPPPDPHVVQKIIEIREHPPDHLQRVPGPKAILYYLHRDPELQAQSVSPPRSTRTIWKILRKLGLILESGARTKRPGEPREPLEEVQIDFKDISTVSADPLGKHQHVVEVLNFVDAGTSILLSAQPHADFHAETALEGVVQFLRQYGRPPLLTFDHDPRWVGSSSGRDFPSALRRFLLCLGIAPNLCPPQRPERNAYVERYHRAYNQECLQTSRPATLEQVREVTARFLVHYNTERPHQGRSCGNRPPRTAFPILPELPQLPETVDPDRWLESVHGQAFARQIGPDGCVTVDRRPYYVKRDLAGQSVVLFVNAPERAFEVYGGSAYLKRIPIKGLYGAEMPLESYIALMLEEARSQERRWRLSQRVLRQRSFWA